MKLLTLSLSALLLISPLSRSYAAEEGHLSHISIQTYTISGLVAFLIAAVVSVALYDATKTPAIAKSTARKVAFLATMAVFFLSLGFGCLQVPGAIGTAFWSAGIGALLGAINVIINPVQTLFPTFPADDLEHSA